MNFERSSPLYYRRLAAGAGSGSGGGDAARTDGLAIVRVFLDKGVDVNIRDSSGMTPLLEVCPAMSFPGVPGNLGIVMMLLNRKADVNAKNEAGDTALLWAVSREDIAMATVDNVLSVVQPLLDAGADPAQKNESGESALSLTETQGSDAIMAVLKGKKKFSGKPVEGAPSLEAPNPRLSQAASAGDMDGVKKALADGAEAGVVNPLLLGVSGMNQDNVARKFAVVKYLADSGIGAGKTNLNYALLTLMATAADAIGEGDFAVVPDVARFLIGKGADVNFRPPTPGGGRKSFEGSALHIAAEAVSPALVQLLRKSGADPNITLRRDSSTPLFSIGWGSEGGYTISAGRENVSADQVVVARMLIAKGARIGAVTKSDEGSWTSRSRGSISHSRIT